MTSEETKAANRDKANKWYEKHKNEPNFMDKFTARTMKRYWETKQDPIAYRALLDSKRIVSLKSRSERKLLVLAHYGPAGKLQCSWPECEIIDVDMLTLDHIENDGFKEPRGVKGINLYCRLYEENLPSGFQTMCWNHQWKKRLLNLRCDSPISRV